MSGSGIYLMDYNQKSHMIWQIGDKITYTR